MMEASEARAISEKTTNGSVGRHLNRINELVAAAASCGGFAISYPLESVDYATRASLRTQLEVRGYKASEFGGSQWDPSPLVLNVSWK